MEFGRFWDGFGIDLGWNQTRAWDLVGPCQPCPSPMKTKAHARQKHARKHELARSKPEKCQKHARTMHAPMWQKVVLPSYAVRSIILPVDDYLPGLGLRAGPSTWPFMNVMVRS